VRKCWSFVVAAVMFVVGPSRSFAQHEQDHAHAAPERFGTVHFPTSCKAEVGPAFERAVALLHSFAYVEAASAFEEVAAKDPDCAMAQWGVAMSYFHTIWGPSTPDEFAAGKKAAEKAAALAAKATPRERDLITAIGAFYQGTDVPHAARVVAYEKAMADASQHHPDDHEIAIFYAVAILGVAYNSPPDKTYARQKQAAEILNRLLPLEPDHPGIAHYMIHSFDFPRARGARAASAAYSKIAPSAPHALHMPSHIFTRLGMWPESSESNLASAQTAQAWLAKTQPGALSFDALHAMDYLEYAYLQSGQDAKARAIVDSVERVTTLDRPVFQAGYALAAIPARYRLERREWKAAAKLTARPASYPWDKYRYAYAIVQFARAVGAARSGDLPGARAAVAQLDTIRTSLKGQKGFDWATQVEIQRRAAAAWLARAEKKNDEALSLMRSAAAPRTRRTSTQTGIRPTGARTARRPAARAGQARSSGQYEPAHAPASTAIWGRSGSSRAGQKERRRTNDRLVAVCGGTVPDQ
jgi:hypothetical protein